MLEAITHNLPGRYFSRANGDSFPDVNGAAANHNDDTLEYDLTQELPPGQNAADSEHGHGASQGSRGASQESIFAGSQHSAGVVAAATMLSQLHGYDVEYAPRGEEDGERGPDLSESAASHALAPEEGDEDDEDELDFTADADKFDVGSELGQRWDALQGELEESIKNYSERVTFDTFTTILRTTKMLERLNGSCHGDLESGVKLIQAEEAKHDAAIARMRSAMDFMERACRALEGR
ncbi:hypothetical protein Q8F55_002172 [Vanrija albida]|uniref:Uncharacterized protein n=1 Tax=Vanrija albida TaxID=181172 RepID=A0ABR3Q912_9TREE